ncbi:MAG: protein kinase [Candidatus Eremiobacteraeota bacterium]|nr:protein kinase [Candidatus Eremiobacteraeota bacterium]
MPAKKPTLIANRYRLGRRLGEGALSIVYLAHDTTLERDVALKVLRAGSGFDDSGLARFHSEARAAAKIAGPNVVAIYDVLEAELGSAIVMEYVDGPSLAERLRVTGALPEQAAVKYAGEIAQALAAAHARGLVHRDIKPSNILLTKDDSVKVADFGLVKALDGSSATLTHSGMFAGSVHYVSPEQAQGKPLGPASDLYSLGIVLFQMLSGRVPFESNSPVATALAHVTQAAPTRRELEAHMSPRLAVLVERLLQKDPGRRYSSAAEVASELTTLGGTPRATVFQNDALDAPTIIAPHVQVPLAARAKTSARTLSPQHRALILAAAGVVLILLIAILSRPTVTVADVRGQTQAQVRSTLARLGLRTVIVPRASESVARGRVIAQHPGAGVRIHRGDAVTVIVSTGLPLVTMPSFTGMFIERAGPIVHRLKLDARIGARFSNAPQNTIITQTPTSGTPVREGTLVKLIISAGPGPSGGD